MPQLLGEKVRHLRRQHDMTQVHLADQLGLAAQAHIAYIESGHDTASLDLTVRIARLFGVSTDYLLRDTVSVEEIVPASNLEKEPVHLDLPQLFGAKLRALRLQHDLGQTDLAHQLGLSSRAYISNLERGRKAPSMDLVVRVADLFGVTTDYLLHDTKLSQPIA